MSLTDLKRVVDPHIADYTEVVCLPAAALVYNLALKDGTMQEVTTSGNTTFNLPAVSRGKSFTLLVLYGGAHALTWAVQGGGTLKWPGGTTPTATGVAGKYDIFTFVCDGAYWFGQTFGANY